MSPELLAPIESPPIEVLHDARVEIAGDAIVGSGHVTIQFRGGVESDPIVIAPFPCDDRRQAEYAADLLIHYLLCLMLDAAADTALQISMVRIDADEAEVVFSVAPVVPVAHGTGSVLHKLRVRVQGVDDWRQARLIATKAVATAARQAIDSRAALTVAALEAFRNLASTHDLVKAAVARAWATWE